MRFERLPAAAARSVSAPKVRRAPGERLAEALLILSGGRARITRHIETNWASITFTGARHSFDLVFEGEAAVEVGEDFIEALPEHDFTIPARLVADAEITKVDHRAAPPLMKISCDLLLIEEG